MHFADPAVDAAGKTTSDRREEKDAPRKKRPADPAIIASAAGKFTPSHKSTSVLKPAHELCGPPPPPQAAFTVPEFCAAHRISVAKYYELKKEGLGPVEMVVGRRRVIAVESAERWRREREADPSAGPSPKG